jgi:N-acylglucosamine 2-epimerase
MSPNLTDPTYRESLRTVYRDTLLHDVMPFWLKHGMDREHDSIITSLQDRWG